MSNERIPHKIGLKPYIFTHILWLVAFFSHFAWLKFLIWDLFAIRTMQSMGKMIPIKKDTFVYIMNAAQIKQFVFSSDNVNVAITNYYDISALRHNPQWQKPDVWYPICFSSSHPLNTTDNKRSPQYAMRTTHSTITIIYEIKQKKIHWSKKNVFLYCLDSVTVRIESIFFHPNNARTSLFRHILHINIPSMKKMEKINYSIPYYIKSFNDVTNCLKMILVSLYTLRKPQKEIIDKNNNVILCGWWAYCSRKSIDIVIEFYYLEIVYHHLNQYFKYSHWILMRISIAFLASI